LAPTERAGQRGWIDTGRITGFPKTRSPKPSHQIVERQWVITQGRKGTLTEADMEYQLGTLTAQQVSLRQEMAESTEIVHLAALADWEIQARRHNGGLRPSIE
jgi:hypothetical protein